MYLSDVLNDNYQSVLKTREIVRINDIMTDSSNVVFDENLQIYCFRLPVH
jgi:hypothetical protein